MTLAIKFLVLAVLAIYARAGAVALRRPISDFYVAGRLVPGLFNGMAIAVSLIPVLAFAELAGVLSQGWDGATLLVLGGAGGLLIIAFFLAPYLRKFGGYTIADFLGERFGGTGVRPLAVLAVILCSFPALALALLGLGVIATQIFAVDMGTGLGLAVAMLLLCSFAAGMRSASVTQIVQYAVLLAVSVVALALLVWQQGAVFSGAEPAGLKAALAIFKLDGFAAEDSLNRFALLFCLVTGIASLPHLLMRGLVTPSIEEARTSFLWALPFTGALSLLAAPLSLAVRGAAGRVVRCERDPLVRPDCRWRDRPSCSRLAAGWCSPSPTRSLTTSITGACISAPRRSSASSSRGQPSCWSRRSPHGPPTRRRTQFR